LSHKQKISNDALLPSILSSQDWQPIVKVMNKKEAIKKMLEGEDVTNIKTLESYHLLLYCNKERMLLKDFKEGDYI